MKVIVKNKHTFETIEYKNVSNIAYDSTTKVYTITHSGGTNAFSGNDYLVAIMFG